MPGMPWPFAAVAFFALGLWLGLVVGYLIGLYRGGREAVRAVKRMVDAVMKERKVHHG